MLFGRGCLLSWPRFLLASRLSLLNFQLLFFFLHCFDFAHFSLRQLDLVFNCLNLLLRQTRLAQLLETFLNVRVVLLKELLALLLDQLAVRFELLFLQDLLLGQLRLFRCSVVTLRTMRVLKLQLIWMPTLS